MNCTVASNPQSKSAVNHFLVNTDEVGPSNTQNDTLSNSEFCRKGIDLMFGRKFFSVDLVVYLCAKFHFSKVSLS